MFDQEDVDLVDGEIESSLTPYIDDDDSLEVYYKTGDYDEEGIHFYSYKDIIDEIKESSERYNKETRCKMKIKVKLFFHQLVNYGTGGYCWLASVQGLDYSNCHTQTRCRKSS